MSHDPVVVVGAGPVGLTCALELARHGVRSVVLEQRSELVHVGSRALVLASHTLNSFARLGIADHVLDKGVRLVRSRTFVRGTEVGRREFGESPGLPPFVNLQQTHTEGILLAAAHRNPLVEVRFGERVVGVEDGHGAATVTTQRGQVRAPFVVACDGARSSVRKLLGLPFPGSSCNARFIIADVRTDLVIPKERRFFFDPPSNPGRQILMHPQPDGEWRLDWLVPLATDADEERASGALDRRIRAVLGPAADYEIMWVTAYRFHHRRLRSLRQGRVFFAGDSAHLMAPFGARGLNSGIEDVTNLCWKIAFVLAAEAPPALLDTYDVERGTAARENLRKASSTARFMAPPNRLHRGVRDAVLHASLRSSRVRRWVNDVRFTEPAVYRGSRHGGTRGPVGRLVQSAPPLPEHARPEQDARLTGVLVDVDDALAGRLTKALLGIPVHVIRCSGDHPLAQILGGGTPGAATSGGLLHLVRPDGYLSHTVPATTSAVRAAAAAALAGRWS